MAEIINLRLARKAQARAAAASKATANRALFGLSKADRATNTLEQVRQKRQLDAHALAKPPAES